MEIEHKKWMTEVIFEGVKLSPISIAIDHLGMHGNLAELSEDSARWLWHFTICHGVNNQEKSDIIKRHVESVLTLVKSQRSHLLQNVPKHFDGPFTEVHLKMWINDLETILKTCENKSVCIWSAED